MGTKDSMQNTTLLEIHVEKDKTDLLVGYLFDKEEKEIIDNNPLKIMKLRTTSNGHTQIHVGKFGCVRKIDGFSCTSEYGFPGKNKSHMGIDLLAPVNTPIFSSVDGIAYINYGVNSTYGKKISVKGKLKNLKTGKEEDVYIFYAHLNSFNIKNGATVKVGDLLGTTGITGNAKNLPEKERHLHLEILNKQWPKPGDGFPVRKQPLNYFNVINP